MHATKLERWLTPGQVQDISNSMKNWYGPPIPLFNVPGKVFAHAGGDFSGTVKAGGFTSFLDAFAKRQRSTLNVGFSSLGDLISKATAGGRSQQWLFSKVGTTGAGGRTNTLWPVGNFPAAGAAASAAPGGAAPTSATTGALPLINTGNTDTIHLVGAQVSASAAPNALLLYDRLYNVTKTMNSTSSEAVTGTPTRYQSTTPGAADSAEGNFLTIETVTTLAATAHNWTGTYTDSNGTTGQTFNATGVSGLAANIIDITPGWFATLAANGKGIRNLTAMQCSAAVATGAITFVIGRPIAFIPTLIANVLSIFDGINTAFNLTRIFDNACLAFLEITKPATTAATYTGSVRYVSG